MPDGLDETGTGSAGRRWAAVAVGVFLLVAWVVGLGGGAATTGAATTIGTTGAAPRELGVAGDDHPLRIYPAHKPLSAATPEHIDIGSIGLHAALIGRGLQDGTVEPPPYDTPDVAGWYRDGPAPGADGAALIVGHVDTKTGAAVFFGLSTVKPGAPVDITRADGTVAEFAVEAVEVVQKAHFDAARVFGSTGRPELRLITCGGSYDPTAQAYSANVVVYAALTGSRPA
jgi:hypothetical protein